MNGHRVAIGYSSLGVLSPGTQPEQCLVWFVGGKGLGLWAGVRRGGGLGEKGEGPSCASVPEQGLTRGTGPRPERNQGGGPGSEAACPAHKYLAFSQRQTQLYFGSGRLQGGLGHFPSRLGPQHLFPLALGMEGTRLPWGSGFRGLEEPLFLPGLLKQSWHIVGKGDSAIQSLFYNVLCFLGFWVSVSVTISDPLSGSLHGNL